MTSEIFDLLMERLDRIAEAVEVVADKAARIEAAIDIAQQQNRESLLAAARTIAAAIDEFRDEVWEAA